MRAGTDSRHDRPDAPLRVLFVSNSPRVWGAERSLLGLVPLLRELGMEPRLASPPGELSEAWSAYGLPHDELAISDHQGLRNGDDGRPGLGALAGEVAETGRSTRRLAALYRNVDVVHSNSLWAHLDCALAGRVAGRPVVLELHDLVRPGLGRTVLRGAVGLSAGAIAISRAVAETVGTRTRRLRVIPQAVDPARFHPAPAERIWRSRLSAEPDAPIVGVVGRVDPEKGLHTVIEAMAMLEGSATRSRLAVVGAPGLDDGSYEAKLRS